MFRFIAFALCFTIILTFDQKFNGYAPENVILFQIFEEIGKIPDRVLEEYSKVALTREQKDAILAVQLVRTGRDSDEQKPDTSYECVGCQLAFTIMPFLLSVGVTFENIKVPTTVVCEIVFAIISTENPYVGQALCGNLIRNYGPHVEFVFKNSKMSPQDSCVLTHFCSNNLVSLDLPGLFRRLFSQRSMPTRHELAPLPFLEPPPYRPARRLRRQAKTIKVVQIADIHVDYRYKEGSYVDCALPLCCHEYPSYWPKGNGSAGPFGEYQCNVPPRTLKVVFQKLKELKPDIVIYTGDSPSSTVWLETQEGQLNATKWVASQLKEYFPNIMGVYATIGNHEAFPTGLYYIGHPHTTTLNHAFYDAYKDLSGFTSEQEMTIKYAGYYTIEIKPGLRLLSLNTNFGGPGNWYNILSRFEPHYYDMLEFMKNTLRNAKRNWEKIILINHHPAGNNIADFDDNITSIIEEFQDVIVLNVAGHNHIDEYRLYRNDSGGVFSVQFLSPPLNTLYDVNPGARIYHLDPFTFELVDYDHYYLDIRLREEATVTKLYSAKQEYGLSDLSPQSIMDFTGRMNNDDEIFDKYLLNTKSLAITDHNCTKDCKVRKLCFFATSTRRHRESCIEYGLQIKPTTESAIVAVAGKLDSISLTLLLIIAALFYTLSTSGIEHF